MSSVARMPRAALDMMLRVRLLLWLLRCAYTRVGVYVRVEQAHHVWTAAVGCVEPRHHVKTKHAHVNVLRLDRHVAEGLHVWEWT